MFQVESGRSVAVHPHPAPGGAPAGHDDNVADHLDRLLGEHLLPLRIRTSGEDEPYLLAVDAAGQPVVVEVVGLLDADAVLRALRYAGRAAGLSTVDLARSYRAGEHRFASDLEAFRETVPVTSLLPTSVLPGSRLLLVCSAIAPGLEEVADFLLQAGSQVQILQVTVADGDNGSRIVDVAPLMRLAPARRAMEPTVIRSSRARLTPPRVPDETTYATGPLPTVIRTSALHRGSGAADGADSDRPTTTPAPAPAGPPLATGFQPLRRAAVVVAPPFAVRLPVQASPADETPDGTDLPRGGHLSLASPDGQVGQDAHRAGPPLTGPSFVSGLPFAFTGVEPFGPDRRLVRLAAAVGAPIALVWVRQRRGEYFEALLRSDGMIELPDGSLCADPHEAAVAVSRASAPVDGWQVWRIERPTGPTLAEALAR